MHILGLDSRPTGRIGWLIVSLSTVSNHKHIDIVGSCVRMRSSKMKSQSGSCTSYATRPSPRLTIPCARSGHLDDWCSITIQLIGFGAMFVITRTIGISLLLYWTRFCLFPVQLLSVFRSYLCCLFHFGPMLFRDSHSRKRNFLSLMVLLVPLLHLWPYHYLYSPTNSCARRRKIEWRCWWISMSRLFFSYLAT